MDYAKTNIVLIPNSQEYHDEVLQLLDAIEPPASLTPRSRLALGLLGLIKVADFNGVEGLHSAGKETPPVNIKCCPAGTVVMRMFVFAVLLLDSRFFSPVVCCDNCLRILCAAYSERTPC